MNKFYNKIQEIEEALSFSNTFKAPDDIEKAKRKREAYDEALDKLDKVKLPDGSWHVRGFCDVSNIGLTSLKELNISRVDGGFHCEKNELVDLEGCPKIVGRSFCCHNNKLTSLKGCPQYITSSFLCYSNKLKTLENGPIHVSHSFSCGDNDLITLKGGPKTVLGDFNCGYCNQLISFEGAPTKLKGGFFSMMCPKIKSFKGMPEIIEGNVILKDCPINSLKGCPKKINGYLALTELTTSVTEKAIRKICEVDDIFYCI